MKSCALGQVDSTLVHSCCMIEVVMLILPARVVALVAQGAANTLQGTYAISLARVVAM